MTGKAEAEKQVRDASSEYGFAKFFYGESWDTGRWQDILSPIAVVFSDSLFQPPHATPFPTAGVSLPDGHEERMRDSKRFSLAFHGPGRFGDPPP